jgi:hypothetical protein
MEWMIRLGMLGLPALPPLSEAAKGRLLVLFSPGPAATVPHHAGRPILAGALSDSFDY